MSRVIRYQGAILYNHQLLLIKHREHATGHSYWVIPGGGIEVGEAEEACVQREMHEETHLEVEVGRLLLDEPAAPGGVYQRRKTYLCRPISGEAQPGYEPVADHLGGAQERRAGHGKAKPRRSVGERRLS